MLFKQYLLKIPHKVLKGLIYLVINFNHLLSI